jgi:hypothetical protein
MQTKNSWKKTFIEYKNKSFKFEKLYLKYWVDNIHINTIFNNRYR